MSLSAASHRRLTQLLTERYAPDIEPPMAMGPTIVRVDDPAADVEEVVEAMDLDTPGGRYASKHLKKGKARTGLGYDKATGTATFGGRACCLTLARSIDRRLHSLPMPSEHQCPECGTRWRVEMRVREERRHG